MSQKKQSQIQADRDRYKDALERILYACSKPFGKDARIARRIALEALTIKSTGSREVKHD